MERLTIDEAIDFCNEKSKNIKLRTEPKTFEQIADWLEELKANRIALEKANGYLEANNRLGYSKGIDDFLEKIQWEYLNGCGIEQKEIEFLIAVSSQVAEQLKAGGVYDD